MTTIKKLFLGERFDVKAFHEVLLMNGGMPLEILGQTIDLWIAERRS